MGRAGTAQSCATHTALSRIFKLNSADISPGLQNTLHSSVLFLAIPFWAKHLPTPWKSNFSSVQFLHGTLLYQYQIHTALIFHSLPPLENSVTPNLHFSPPNTSILIIPPPPLPKTCQLLILPLLQPNLTSAATETALVMHQLVTVGLALWHMAQGGAHGHTATVVAK